MFDASEPREPLCDSDDNEVRMLVATILATAAARTLEMILPGPDEDDGARGWAVDSMDGRLPRYGVRTVRRWLGLGEVHQVVDYGADGLPVVFEGADKREALATCRLHNLGGSLSRLELARLRVLKRDMARAGLLAPEMR